MPRTIDDIVKKVQENHPQADTDLVRLAYDYAKEAHHGQRRKSGAYYIEHPVETAYKLAELGLDPITIVAALLHDVPEDTRKTLDDIRDDFGSEVEKLVRGITKLGKIKYRGIDRYVENLRRMFVAMAEDIRVILIKLADRIHNLETLDALPKDRQKRIALESIEIYAPIANRLGMGELRGNIEDLAFPYVYPKEYHDLKERITPRLEEAQKNMISLIEKTKKLLGEHHVNMISIEGRAKHLYSLYKKLQRYENDLDRIYDLIAIRIIVPTVSDCYAILGLVHDRWRPLKGRIKDYIAVPKPNGYQSLHTTVFCDEGKIVEFQIRTLEMHQLAEWGIAAHWYYKESASHQSSSFSKDHLPWLEQLEKLHQESANEKQYLESLKIEVFQDRIFVFTPKGDVIDLPEDSTPIDFAYHIHSDIGHKAIATKVNEELKPMDTKLRSGDVVEIITDKNRKGPNSDWLKFVKTPTARRHIKMWLRRERRNPLTRLLRWGERA
ncbi:MAG: RelA/SpoT family protein [Patescibacteria group bacterium]